MSRESTQVQASVSADLNDAQQTIPQGIVGERIHQFESKAKANSTASSMEHGTVSNASNTDIQRSSYGVSNASQPKAAPMTTSTLTPKPPPKTKGKNDELIDVLQSFMDKLKKLKKSHDKKPMEPFELVQKLLSLILEHALAAAKAKIHQNDIKGHNNINIILNKLSNTIQNLLQPTSDLNVQLENEGPSDLINNFKLHAKEQGWENRSFGATIKGGGQIELSFPSDEDAIYFFQEKAA